ncbi:hypothetical protein [Flavihumibacter solisilvae]|uniref:hypothetical protein n=1 Tax=Flavihumibacter solisilvae TaxID=1349421 RepID=UPI003B82F0CE
MSGNYKSTGKDRLHQLRIYPRGSMKAFPGHACGVAGRWCRAERWNSGLTSIPGQLNYTAVTSFPASTSGLRPP